MQFAETLFIAENVDNQAKVIKALKARKKPFNLYLIAYDLNGSTSLMEVLSVDEVFNSVNKKRSLRIIGLAYGKLEAFDLVKEIIDSALSRQIDIKSFIKKL